MQHGGFCEALNAQKALGAARLGRHGSVVVWVCGVVCDVFHRRLVAKKSGCKLHQYQMKLHLVGIAVYLTRFRVCRTIRFCSRPSVARLTVHSKLRKPRATAEGRLPICRLPLAPETPPRLRAEVLLGRPRSVSTHVYARRGNHLPLLADLLRVLRHPAAAYSVPTTAKQIVSTRAC